jgi:hypothetical protein
MSQLIESALAEELRDLAAQQPSGPDLDAIIRRGRVLRRRRVLVPGASAAVVAACAAAIALAGGPGPAASSAHSPGTSAQPGEAVAQPGVTAGQRGGAVSISSASVLEARLTAAYTAAKATLKVTDVYMASGATTEIISVPSQKWSETIDWNASGAKETVDFTYQAPGEKQGTLTVYNGKNQKETLKGPFWVFKTLRLDYATHRFYIDTSYVQVTKDTEKNADAQFFPVPEPESLKTSSWSKLTGTATVDGQAAYVLAQTGSGGVTATTWVNQQTLLPIKDVVHTYVGTSTDDYTYSTATGATAAASEPAIPPGFTDGDSSGGAGAPAVPAP